MQVERYAEESQAIKDFREELLNPTKQSPQFQPSRVLHKPSSPEVLEIMKRLLQQ